MWGETPEGALLVLWGANYLYDSRIYFERNMGEI
jgi:hypothetical protein